MPTPDETTIKAQQPAFAKEWMAQWRYAARELPKIRARELRAMTDQQAIDLLDVIDGRPQQSQRTMSGLIVQQAWFQRMRQLQLGLEKGSGTNSQMAQRVLRTIGS